MSDPTPFPTDPLEPVGADPDLSKDDDDRGDAADAEAGRPEDAPDDRAPTLTEQQRDRIAAENQDPIDPYSALS